MKSSIQWASSHECYYTRFEGQVVSCQESPSALESKKKERRFDCNFIGKASNPTFIYFLYNLLKYLRLTLHIEVD